MQEEGVVLFHPHHHHRQQHPQSNAEMEPKRDYGAAQHNPEEKSEFEEEFDAFDENAMLGEHEAQLDGHGHGHHPSSHIIEEQAHMEENHRHLEGHYPHLGGHHHLHMQGHHHPHSMEGHHHPHSMEGHHHPHGMQGHHHAHIQGNHLHMDGHHDAHMDEHLGGNGSHMEGDGARMEGHDPHMQAYHPYIVEGHPADMEGHETSIDGDHHQQQHHQQQQQHHEHHHHEHHPQLEEDDMDEHHRHRHRHRVHLEADCSQLEGGDMDEHRQHHLRADADGAQELVGMSTRLEEEGEEEEEEEEEGREEDAKMIKKEEEEEGMVGEQAVAVATKSNQRRLWKKDRSQAWWDRCNEPEFPEAEFQHAFRMSKAAFEHLCEEIGHAVAKEDTMLRQAIPVRQRVAVCIWRLASGEPLRLLSKRFGLGISTCHKLVIEVCTAINDVLLPKHICWASSHEHSQAIREAFERITGIPGVVGAIYTTHMPIIAPKVNVTSYFNRGHTERTQKTSYSLALQGVVDAHGLFADVCIGWPGSLSDELVLEKSALYERGLSGFFGSGGDWIVGGPSFPPLDWLLTPYVDGHLTWAQLAFNERLDEALKIASSAFGKLKGRWQYLTKRAEIKVQELPTILGACCVLHNLCEKLHEPFDPGLFVLVQDDLTPCEHLPWSSSSLERRDSIAHSFMRSSASPHLNQQHHRPAAANNFSM